MKQKVLSNIKNNWHLWILVLIIAGAALLRGYNVNDWLVFKSDQARDVAYAGQVLEGGMGNLRLMGPKIEVVHIEGDASKRGDSLHLGPAYYYIQAAAAYLFSGAKPWTAALPDFILSILAIPLFYYFLRLNFSRGLSLLTTVLFAFGFFLTQYGRFSWNPNQLIFWEMIFAIAIIKSYLSPDRNISGRWILAGAFAFGVASQLHTIALFSFPVIAGAFWIFYRPKSGLKYWALAALILLTLYLPVFVYEYKNNGDNTKRLIASMQRERDDDGGLLKSIKKDIQRHGEFAAVTLTTFHNREIRSIEKAGAFFYFISIVAVFFIYANSRLGIMEKITKNKQPDDSKKKPFLGLILIWALVVFLLFIKLAPDLNRARYFIVISPLVYVFLVFWFENIRKLLKRKMADAAIALVFLLVLFSNGWAIAYFYKSLANGVKASEMMRSPKMNYYDDLVTLGDLRNGLDYMAADSGENNVNICLHTYDYQYKSVFNLLGEIYYPGTVIENFGPVDLIKNCRFYVAVRSEKGIEDIDEKFWEKFQVVDRKVFDFLTVFRIEHKSKFNNLANLKGANAEDNKKDSLDDDPRITTWNEVFDKK